MIKFKKYFIFAGIFTLFYLFISLIYILTNIPYNIISSIILIFNLISFFVLGYIIAKKSKNKGIIIGLKISSIIILIIFILGLLFKYPFSIKSIIYYLLIVLTTTFGSIVSKNTKK